MKTNNSDPIDKALNQLSQDVTQQINYQSSQGFGRAILWIKNKWAELTRGNVNQRIDHLEKLFINSKEDAITQKHLHELGTIKFKSEKFINNSIIKDRVSQIETLAISKLHGPSAAKLPTLTNTTIQTNATYETCRNNKNEEKSAEEGIIDVSFVDSKRGFAYVANGTSHGRPDKKEAIRQGFQEFNTHYQEALKEHDGAFGSVQETIAFVKKTVTAFEKDLDQKNSSLVNSAFALAQTVTINGQKRLITASYADCMIVVRRENGTLEHTTAQNQSGLGCGEALNINVFALEDGDEVFGITDGIGEFLTEDQFKEVLDNNKDRNKLLDELKEKIIDQSTLLKTMVKKYIADPPTFIKEKTDQYEELEKKAIENLPADYKNEEFTNALLTEAFKDPDILNVISNQIQEISDGEDDLNVPQKAIGGGTIKFHNPEDPNCYDDIALFSFKAPSSPWLEKRQPSTHERKVQIGGERRVDKQLEKLGSDVIKDSAFEKITAHIRGQDDDFSTIVMAVQRGIDPDILMKMKENLKKVTNKEEKDALRKSQGEQLAALMNENATKTPGNKKFDLLIEFINKREDKDQLLKMVLDIIKNDDQISIFKQIESHKNFKHVETITEKNELPSYVNLDLINLKILLGLMEDYVPDEPKNPAASAVSPTPTVEAKISKEQSEPIPDATISGADVKNDSYLQSSVIQSQVEKTLQSLLQGEATPVPKAERKIPKPSIGHRKPRLSTIEFSEKARLKKVEEEKERYRELISKAETLLEAAESGGKPVNLQNLEESYNKLERELKKLTDLEQVVSGFSGRKKIRGDELREIKTRIERIIDKTNISQTVKSDDQKDSASNDRTVEQDKHAAESIEQQDVSEYDPDILRAVGEYEQYLEGRPPPAETDSDKAVPKNDPNILEAEENQKGIKTPTDSEKSIQQGTIKNIEVLDLQEYSDDQLESITTLLKNAETNVNPDFSATIKFENNETALNFLKNYGQKKGVKRNGSNIKLSSKAYQDLMRVPLAHAKMTQDDSAPRYEYFKKDLKEVISGHLDTKSLKMSGKIVNVPYRYSASGCSGVADQIIEVNPNAKIGVMIAANSGLPAGALGKEWDFTASWKDKLTLINKNANKRTQEESVIAQMLLAGIKTKETNQDKEQYADNFMATVLGEWGLEYHAADKATMTKQGVDYTKAKSSEYKDAHLVTGAGLYTQCNKKTPKTPTPVHAVVFADSVNAGGKGRNTGTMTRTLNEKAAKDKEVFKECVKNKLRASLDAMVQAGVTHALVAELSCGVYRPKGANRTEMEKEFRTLLKEVLNEQPGGKTDSLRRYQYFEEVIIPKLG